MLVALADHEAHDVLEKEQRNAALAAEFDEVCALEGGFGEENAVVGEDADEMAVDPRKARHQCGPEAGFELFERALVHDARDELPRRDRFAE